MDFMVNGRLYYLKDTNIVYENNTYIIDYFTSCIKENCYLKKKLNIHNSSNSDVCKDLWGTGVS